MDLKKKSLSISKSVQILILSGDSFMHSSFKVYLLTGTFCQGNGQLCQFNLSQVFLTVELLLLMYMFRLHQKLYQLYWSVHLLYGSKANCIDIFAEQMMGKKPKTSYLNSYLSYKYVFNLIRSTSGNA